MVRVSQYLNNLITRWVLDEDEERQAWSVKGEKQCLNGRQVGIKTSFIEEKCQTFETLVIQLFTLGAHFAPYIQQSLELALPALKFLFHGGVREAYTMYIRLC